MTRSEGADPIELEGLLSDALHPVDPPAELVGFEERIAAKVSGIADRAEGFGDGEKMALHDPRSWAGPAVAGTVVVLSASAAALAYVGRRRKRAQGRAGSLIGRTRR